MVQKNFTNMNPMEFLVCSETPYISTLNCFCVRLNPNGSIFWVLCLVTTAVMLEDLTQTRKLHFSTKQTWTMDLDIEYCGTLSEGECLVDS